MPTKRKQPSRASKEAWPSGVPLKRIITNPPPSSYATPSTAPKTKRSADEFADDASTTLSSPRPAKKMKTTVQSEPKAATPARKTKQAPKATAPAPKATSQAPKAASPAPEATSSAPKATLQAPKATSPARKTRKPASARRSTTPVLPPKTSFAIKAHSKRAAKASTHSTTLVPHIPRQRAIVGQKDESLLRITGRSAITHKTNDLRFRLIPYASIDWNNPHHIGKINSWRNQIYQRAGIKTRLIVSWHELEELWIELYYQLSIVEARQRSILLPSPRQMRESFNEMFVGRVLKDRRGRRLAPRGERHATAFGSKFNRMFPVLKSRLNTCVAGKGRDIFMPEIRFSMLLAYKAKKADMGVESENAVDGEEWQRLLEELYDVDDAEEQDLTEQEDEEEDADLEGEEEDAALEGEEEDEDLEDEQDLIPEEEADEADASAAEEEEHHLTQDQEAIDLAAKEALDLAAMEADAIQALLSLANDTWMTSSASSHHTIADDFPTPDVSRSARTSFSQAESDSTLSAQEQYTGSLEGTTHVADSSDDVGNAAGDRGYGYVVGCKACDVHAAHMRSGSHRPWTPVGETYLGK